MGIRHLLNKAKRFLTIFQSIGKRGMLNTLPSIIIVISIFLISVTNIYADEDASGNITSDTIWKEINGPYIVSGDIYIYGSSNPTLTIESGTEVRFSPGKGIYVGYVGQPGSIIAQGSDVKKIKFTSSETVDPQKGDWGSIYFQDSADDTTSVLDHCIIEYGGASFGGYRGNIICNNAMPTIKNCTISNSSDDGIFIYGEFDKVIGGAGEGNLITENAGYGVYCEHDNSMPTLIENTITDNGFYPVRIRSNLGESYGNTYSGNLAEVIFVATIRISQNTTWYDNEIPYYISNDFNIYGSISTAATLTILPGVEVRFASGRGINVGFSSYLGALSAAGEVGNKIVFTSENVSDPQKGDWGAIYFQDKTDDTASILNHCIIEYGGTSFGGYRGNIICNNAMPTIKNCTISNSSDDGIFIYGEFNKAIGGDGIGNTITNNNGAGIYCNNSSGQPSLIENTITNNGSYPVRVVSSLGQSYGNTFNGNLIEVIYMSTSRIDVDTTWYNNGFPYYISSDNLRIYGTQSTAAKLTIEPGVEIRFGSGGGMQIGFSSYLGALIAEGEDGNEIIFTTADVAAPSKGDWGALYFDDNSMDDVSILDYCKIEYAGASFLGQQGGIVCYNSMPTIKNSTISDSLDDGIFIYGEFNKVIGGVGTGNTITNNNGAGIYCNNSSGQPSLIGNTITGNGSYAIRTSAAALPNILGNTYGGNTPEAIYLLAGEINESADLENNISYIVGGNITICGDGATTAVLTIHAGTILYFNDNYYMTIGKTADSVNYLGAISAQGAEASPIIFTSSRTSPSRGVWGGLYFTDQTDDVLTTLDHCIVEWAGYSNNGKYGNIIIDNASFSIRYSTVRLSSNNGIYLSGTGSSSAEISCNKITDNYTGVLTESDAFPTIQNNDFTININYGVRNNSAGQLDATLNYWNSESGPGSGGDNVLGNIDYSNYLLLDDENRCAPDLKDNFAPNQASSPYPADGSFNIPVDVDLTWAGNDPNLNDTLLYTVYIGTTPNELQVEANNLSDTTLSLTGLTVGTTYYWKVDTTDGANETEGQVWSFSVEGGTPDLIISNISWAPATDISANSNVAITGTIQNTGTGPVTESFQVDFQIDAASIGPVTVNSIIPIGGSVDVTQGWLAQIGNHNITVIADSANQIAESVEGNNDSTEALPGISDQAPPALVSSNPINGSYITNITQITMTLYDEYDDIDAFRVMNESLVYLDGVIFDGDFTNDGDTFIFTAVFPEGNYTVDLKAADVAGNAINYPIQFTIDNTPPASPTVNPVTTPTETPTQLITGTKDVDASVWLDDSEIIGNTSETTWQYTASLNSGDNTFSFASKDLAGNTSAALSVYIYYDNMPPAIVDSADISTNGDGIGTIITVDWSGYDEASQNDVKQYRIYAESTNYTSVPEPTYIPKRIIQKGTFTCSVDGLSRESDYYISVVAEDEMGNFNPSVNTVLAITKDVVAPGDVSNPEISCISNGLSLSWTAPSDADLDGFLIQGDNGVEDVTVSAGQTIYDFGSLNPATFYTFSIQAYDGSPEPNYSNAVNISGITTLPNPDTITATPTEAYIDLEWNTVSPSDEVEKYAVYKLPDANGSSIPGDLVAYGFFTGTEVAITARIGSVTVGQNNYFGITTINHTGCEDRNNVTKISVLVEADTTPPLINSVTVDGAELTDGYLLMKMSDVYVYATDDNGIDRVEFYFDGGLVFTNSGSSSPYGWILSVPDEDGDHTFQVIAFDTAAGENSTASQIYTIRTNKLPSSSCLNDCL